MAASPVPDFIFQNLQTALSGNNSVTIIPFVQAMERQSALTMSGRQPGQPNYRGNSAATNGSIVLVDGMETMASALGYAKNVCTMLTLNATAAATLNLFTISSNATVVAANAISVAKDAVFTTMASWNTRTGSWLTFLEIFSSAP